ncbi:MAG: flagellar biosynthesis protein FlhA [Myxococcales bacterium]|nr:flagellar biosynthesis protein FlhA [Myxococcales bacterium]
MNEISKPPGRGNIATATGLVLIVLLMILPVPPAMMDALLALSISVAMVILVGTLYIERPSDFSVFPALLLGTTLLRLSLNVGTTRLILLHGHEGTEAAGRVISTFGTFVVGGNYVVGVIVFLILIIINFMVITKGAGRIAEVSARFTLDAMPGKQMAIDADLGAGIIDDREAKRRREEIRQEADFYGSMDGASKFVRGDAIAGLMITAINIIAGLIIGVAQREMPLAAAATNYTVLTIGDGLVSQMPALLISVAAGIVVARAGSKGLVSEELTSQLFQSGQKLRVVSVVVAGMALIPGMPTIPFLVLGGGFFYLAQRASGKEEEEASAEAQSLKSKELEGLSERERLERMLPVDMIALEVSYPLIPLVDASRDGDLLDRIMAVRKQVALQLGLIIPQIHIRDNVELPANEYRILIKGVEVAKGESLYGQFLAMDPGHVIETIEGIPTVEPAFGLDALWIDASKRDEAELSGYTVVDSSTVIATHLTEVISNHVSELLGSQELDDILRVTAKSAPKLVDDLVPAKLSNGELLRILRNLVREKVSIRDMRTILETLADRISETRNTDILTEYIRYRLGPAICTELADEERTIHGIVLSGGAAQAIRESLTAIDSEIHVGLQPETARTLLQTLQDQMERFALSGRQPLVIVPAEIRRPLRDFVARHLSNLVVLSHREVPSHFRLEVIGEVPITN